MTDETDKLAAQMKNLRPSKASRESGMSAAMAAFNQEFSAESSADKAAISGTKDKNLKTTQGSADAPRPTGTPTKTVRVTTRRVQTMAKLKSAFNFKPQTMMMAGTCAAALMAAVIVLPNMDELSQDVPLAAIETVKVDQDLQAPTAALDERAKAVLPEVAQLPEPAPEPAPAPEARADDIIILKSRRSGNEASQNDVPVRLDTVTAHEIGDQAAVGFAEVQAAPAPSEAPPGNPFPTPTAEAQGGIGPINSLLSPIRQNSAKIEAENKAREKRFRQKATQQSSVMRSQGFTSQTPPPPPQLIGRLAANNPTMANSRAEIAGRTRIALPGNGSDAQAPVSQIEKVGGLTLEIVPGKPDGTGLVNTSTQEQFTVFNGVSNEVIQSTETIVSETGEILARVLIPAKYKTITKQVLVSPAKSEKVIIPAVTKDVVVKLSNGDGTFKEVINKVVIEEERVDYIVTPAKYETRSERILVAPAREDWKPGTQAINAGAFGQKPVPPKYILRDDDGTIIREFESRDAFEIYKANLPTPVAETPVSTFSVDVDTSSYSFLRASINRGQLPPRSSIRLEEMINYFPYDYDAPKSADEPFKANVTVTSNPWNADTKLMHIGIKGYVPKQTEKPRSNLVFLIDTSGSMRQQNKLPLLVNSFKLLLNTLDEDDTVSIVAYASASGTVLEPTKVKNKSEILAALNNLRAGGSTAGEAGLELAYQKAQESFDDEGVNRVILATDGDFNVGFSSPDDMKSFIQKKRKTGIFLSVLGFGMGNYNDHLMQSLAQNGNGVAAYIDSLSEANKVLANEAGSALFTIAKDVKIQVEFNPSEIAEYRLIGYETRALNRQDFNNDKVDAGEIGAGHSVTAIYEMTPVGSPAVTVDKLRYASETPKTSTGSDEYAFVKIRHKLPDAEKSTLQTFPIGKRQERRLKRASDDMRFAAAVAAVGQKLRGDTAVEDYSYEDAIKLAKSAKGKDENGYRAEFIQLVQLIDSLDETGVGEIQQKPIRPRR